MGAIEVKKILNIVPELLDVPYSRKETMSELSRFKFYLSKENIK